MTKGTHRKESSQRQAWDNHADGWRLSGSTEAHVDNRKDLRGKLSSMQHQQTDNPSLIIY